MTNPGKTAGPDPIPTGTAFLAIAAAVRLLLQGIFPVLLAPGLCWPGRR